MAHKCLKSCLLSLSSGTITIITARQIGLVTQAAVVQHSLGYTSETNVSATAHQCKNQLLY